MWEKEGSIVERKLLFLLPLSFFLSLSSVPLLDIPCRPPPSPPPRPRPEPPEKANPGGQTMPRNVKKRKARSLSAPPFPRPCGLHGLLLLLLLFLLPNHSLLLHTHTVSNRPIAAGRREGGEEERGGKEKERVEGSEERGFFKIGKPRRAKSGGLPAALLPPSPLRLRERESFVSGWGVGVTQHGQRRNKLVCHLGPASLNIYNVPTVLGGSSITVARNLWRRQNRLAIHILFTDVINVL